MRQEGKQGLANELGASTPAMPSATSKYIAASANRAPTSACRVSDGLVAYGSGHFIALWLSSVRSSAPHLSSYSTSSPSHTIMTG